MARKPQGQQTAPVAKRPATKRSETKRRTAKRSASANGGVCFVMSSFGGWSDSYYNDIFAPAVRAAGLEPHRADDLFHPGVIVKDIWEYVKKSRVLVADLTGQNPNVFYELGLAHALSKPVVLVAQSLNDVPFDLRSLRVVTYVVLDPRWPETLRTDITSSLRAVLASPGDAILQPFGHPVGPDREGMVAADVGSELRSLRQEFNTLRADVQSGRLRSPLGLGIYPSDRLLHISGLPEADPALVTFAGGEFRSPYQIATGATDRLSLDPSIYSGLVITPGDPINTSIDVSEDD